MNRIPVEEFLSSLLAGVQAIARKLVGVARKRMPGAHEFIYHNAVGYSVSDSPFDGICCIAPQWKEAPASAAKIHAGRKPGKG